MFKGIIRIMNEVIFQPICSTVYSYGFMNQPTCKLPVLPLEQPTHVTGIPTAMADPFAEEDGFTWDHEAHDIAILPYTGPELD